MSRRMNIASTTIAVEIFFFNLSLSQRSNDNIDFIYEKKKHSNCMTCTTGVQPKTTNFIFGCLTSPYLFALSIFFNAMKIRLSFGDGCVYIFLHDPPTLAVSILFIFWVYRKYNEIRTDTHCCRAEHQIS